MPVAIGLQFSISCQRGRDQLIDLPRRRRGREAEGGGLLNRYTVKSRIEGSNPSVSATSLRAKEPGRRRLRSFVVTMRPNREG